MNLKGEDEATAFLDGPPNNLSKQPEKGILKKSGGIYGPLGGGPVGGHPSLSLPLRMGSLNKEKWCEESQSDNQEVLSVLMSPDGTRSDRMGGASSLSDVERTLKSLNGYHEDILQVFLRAHSLPSNMMMMMITTMNGYESIILIDDTGFAKRSCEPTKCQYSQFIGRVEEIVRRVIRRLFPAAGLLVDEEPEQP